MARYEEISIDEIIAGVKPQLRLSNTTEHDDWFTLLAYEAVRHLDALSIFEKQQCILDVKDKKSKLPLGFTRLLSLRFLSDDDSSSSSTTGRSNFNNFLYVDSKFLNDNGQSTNLAFIRTLSQFFQIEKGFIYYNSEITAPEVEIAFFGLNLDKEGRPVIYADYERALKAYIGWKFTRTYSEFFKESDIRAYQKEWQGQRAKLRGLDFKNNFENNKRKLAELASAIVVSRLQNSISDPGY